MSQGPLTIREASERLGFSVRTITRLFEREPGVLIQVEFYVGVVGHAATPTKDVAELERLFSVENPRG